ncbi:hypothetical protein E4U57_002549 [Claviceps arundinis]|uniref:DNA mismatch repair proteins mutS family domain-containing protein n=1 Tax=Claviceps arundinis TaxID=1623583 RepID=A0ABQ7P8E0_9HYPO|nr:hypothetical protein E4U57_002549 [Claviceps arundinis]
MKRSSKSSLATASTYFQRHGEPRGGPSQQRKASTGRSTARTVRSVASTAPRTSRSNTRGPVSRPSTSASSRKSRPGTLSTILGTNYDDQTIICALGEARGVFPLVGVALVNISLGEATLSQICDNQSYVKTIHKLQMANPSRIVFTATACPPVKDNVLFTLVNELIPDARIELLDRSAWSETDGLEYIHNLAFETDIDPIKVAVLGKYYSVSSFAASLEIVQNANKSKSKDCLFGVLNQTLTPMGSRMLRSNILQPPTKYDTFIAPRYDAVEELTAEEETFQGVRAALKDFTDVEKMITLKRKFTIAEVEEDLNRILMIKRFLESIPPLHQALSGCQSPLLLKIRDICEPTVSDPILQSIKAIIEEDVTVMSSPLDMRNARTFAVKAGISGMLDVARQTYKELTEEVHLHVQDVEKEYGASVTLKFDNARKYWLLLKGLAGSSSQVPPVFINVVEKKGGIECHTMQLMKLNSRLSDTSNEIIARSDAIIQDLIVLLRESAAQLFRLCESVGLLDMVTSFAHLSILRDYVRPEFRGTFALKAARHPIMDKILYEEYVPNDYYASEQNCFQIVTGCNMAGKSTYIKAAALLQIMAQVGSFVPAAYASFSLINNIFARVSLSDSLEANLSTFSVEMREMAFILRNVDGKSLVVIDELGRGTSTRDGLAIAIAMSEALIQSKAFVWFATHFVDLVHVLGDRPGVVSLHLASERRTSDEGVPQLAMLYKATQGTVDTTEHYGIELARSIGFSEEFTRRAEEVASDIRRRREQNRQCSEARNVLARRKLVLNLYETLQQAAEHGDDAVLPGYLKSLQEEFILRMNELSVSSST